MSKKLQIAIDQHVDAHGFVKAEDLDSQIRAAKSAAGLFPADRVEIVLRQLVPRPPGAAPIQILGDLFVTGDLTVEGSYRTTGDVLVTGVFRCTESAVVGKLTAESIAVQHHLVAQRDVVVDEDIRVAGQIVVDVKGCILQKSQQGEVVANHIETGKLVANRVTSNTMSVTNGYVYAGKVDVRGTMRIWPGQPGQIEGVVLDSARVGFLVSEGPHVIIDDILEVGGYASLNGDLAVREFRIYPDPAEKMSSSPTHGGHSAIYGSLIVKTLINPEKAEIFAGHTPQWVDMMPPKIMVGENINGCKITPPENLVIQQYNSEANRALRKRIHAPVVSVLSTILDEGRKDPAILGEITAEQSRRQNAALAALNSPDRRPPTNQPDGFGVN